MSNFLAPLKLFARPSARRKLLMSGKDCVVSGLVSKEKVGIPKGKVGLDGCYRPHYNHHRDVPVTGAGLMHICMSAALPLAELLRDL